MPDSFSSGSYSVSASVEPQYIPIAFKPEILPDVP